MGTKPWERYIQYIFIFCFWNDVCSEKFLFKTTKSYIESLRSWFVCSFALILGHLSKRLSFSDHKSNTVVRRRRRCRQLFFFSRTTGSILTKLDKNHPWVKGIHVCSNEGLRRFPRGDNKITKIHNWNLRNFLRNHRVNFNRTSFGE